METHVLSKQEKIRILQRLVSGEPYEISDYELNSRVKKAVISKITYKNHSNTRNIEIEFTLPSNDTITKPITELPQISNIDSQLGTIVDVYYSDSEWIIDSEPKQLI